MAYYPQQIKTKSELQEATTEIELSCDHLTTMNFGEPNVVYYRHNTPREKWEGDISVFARPYPMQQPVMAKATHNLKGYYVPFRVLSPQWNAFVNKSPYTPYNTNVVIQVQEMPYFTPYDMYAFITDTAVSVLVTSADPNQAFDFKIDGNNYRLTTFGKYCVKILNQLGYQIIVDKNSTAKTHFDAMAILAYAKIYHDFYYNSQYARTTTASIKVESLFKKDGVNAYNLSAADLLQIFDFTQYVFYEPDFFTSQWDNPFSPNNAGTTIGTISLTDLSVNKLEISRELAQNKETPTIHDQGDSTKLSAPITQYAIDSLKKMTDFCVRFSMAGVYEVDRYLARFGVLLSAEKMKRAVYYGEQKTPMEFGAIYSTAATNNANIGDYAGSGTINSDGKEHKHFEIESDEYGIIMFIGTIIPKIGYYQGVDRNNLHHEIETYFSGVFDQLGTQATSSAEVYVSEDCDGAFNGDSYVTNIFGYIPRGAEYKTPRDRLTGDFVRKSINIYAGSWHLFRTFEDSYWSAIGGVSHAPYFTAMYDREQYLRIFDHTKEEEDHFNVIYQIKAKARIHAKPLYDTYDFESEGKELMLAGIGPKQN